MRMVRLIAADMDGTLLNDEKELPDETISVIRALQTMGVHFAVASGRQYKNLLTYFAEVSDIISFICVNGSLIYDRGQLVSIHEINPDLLHEPIRAAQNIAGTHVIATCVNGVYTESRDPAFLRFTEKYFCDLQLVDSLEKVLKMDKVVQCSIYHPDARRNVLPALSEFAGGVDLYLSEDMWVDIHRKGIDKGTGLRDLQHRYGITAEESMAFGDYLNDVGLMNECVHTFAMKGAHPDLAAVCRYRIGSNNEGAAVRAIKEWFSIGKTSEDMVREDEP